jgi:hypothetical protein
MVSNVSHYPFDPARDEYFAYERSNEIDRHHAGHRASSHHVYGQIPFDVPWVSVPDSHTGPTHISFEELEIELERAARRQED